MRARAIWATRNTTQPSRNKFGGTYELWQRSSAEAIRSGNCSLDVSEIDPLNLESALQLVPYWRIAPLGWTTFRLCKWRNIASFIGNHPRRRAVLVLRVGLASFGTPWARRFAADACRSNGTWNLVLDS